MWRMIQGVSTTVDDVYTVSFKLCYDMPESVFIGFNEDKRKTAPSFTYHLIVAYILPVGVQRW